MNFVDSFYDIKWRFEGCILGLWLTPLWSKSKVYPMTQFPLSKVQYLLIRILFFEEWIE